MREDYSQSPVLLSRLFTNGDPTVQRLRVIDRLAEQPWIQDPTNPLEMAVEQ